MQRFDNLADIVDWGSHFGAHWMLKGVQKTDRFGTNRKHEKTEVQETGWKKQDILIIF